MSIEVLMRKLEQNPINTILSFNELVYSCNDLIDEIRDCETFLENHEIKKGKCVNLIGDYSLSTIAMLIALIRKKCVIVPTLPYDHDRKKRNLVSKILDFQIEIVDNEPNIRATETNTLETHPLIEQLRQDDSCGLILFTSGTTGEPKGVVHNFDKLLRKFSENAETLKPFRSVTILLFDHWGGLNTLFHNLYSLGFLALIQDRKPETVAKAIEQHKLELLPASPSFINLFLISGVISKYDLKSLKWITYGAETMPESTLKRLNQLLPQVKLKQTYGLIEIGVLATKSQSDSSTLIKLGGKGYEIRVIDQQLEIKAESSMLGYLNAESPFTEDGFFKTGDYVEEHGEWIKILGRKSNLIFTAGEKVHPSEVESVILECEGVDDVLVFGKPNPLLGNIVSAIVKIGSSLDKEKVKKEILNTCRSKLSRIKVPMSIEFTHEDLFTMRLKKERR